MLSDEDLAPWWLFRATKPGIRVRDILKEHKIETLRKYQHRSRQQINEAREKRRKDIVLAFRGVMEACRVADHKQNDLGLRGRMRPSTNDASSLGKSNSRILEKNL